MQVNISSIQVHTDFLANSTNNIANININDFKATETTLDNENGEVVAQSTKTNHETDLAKELTDQISITDGIKANTQAIKAQDKMIGLITPPTKYTNF